MRRWLILVFLLSLSWSVAAEESVWQVLQSVSRFMNADKGYEVEFVINAEGFTSEGRYCVKGKSYYIEVADAEVYSDGEVRYEVDNLRHEVNVDVMDYASRNILDNPTRCFDFVEEDYTAEVVERNGEQVSLKLCAKDKQLEGEIYLTVVQNTGLPKRLEYVLYDDRVIVTVESVEKLRGEVKGFNRSTYKDYEIIDFR